MSTSICQIVSGNVRRLEQEKMLNILEVFNTPESNTKTQCEELQKKLKDWKNRIIIYGDASNQRRTETADVNDTNWTIVKQYFPNAEYKVPSFNPNVMERISWVNSKFENFDRQVGIQINDVGCEGMITDMNQVVWAKNGKEKDKSNKLLTHNSDTLDYIISEEFPLLEEALAMVA
jgi:hypothetical protein